MNKGCLFFALNLILNVTLAQAVRDQSFHYEIETPQFKNGEGPILYMDAAHHNRHTMQTGLRALSEMLMDDGVTVKENRLPFSPESLKKMDVLVIVNALDTSNLKRWKLPCPSAFTSEEIKAVERWVHDGGSLFLSADHMPYGGAVQDLAHSFGVTWANCFDRSLKKQWPPAVFSRDKGTLKPSLVTDSSAFSSRIEYIGTFTGSAFKSQNLTPFLVFNERYELLFPDVAWKFSGKTKKLDAKGWFQGAYMKYGEGKVVLMGESAMFTAQVRGKTKIGMNSPFTPENAALALNIFRYLAIEENE
ncbi:MAG: DUF4350 domain-containing protein [Bacteroidota bacterium]